MVDVRWIRHFRRCGLSHSMFFVLLSNETKDRDQKVNFLDAGRLY